MTTNSKHTPEQWQAFIQNFFCDGCAAALAEAAEGRQLISLAWMLPELVQALESLLSAAQCAMTPQTEAFRAARIVLARYYEQEARK